MTKLEQHREVWPNKSDEWLFERLANELKDKVETIHKLLTENEQLRTAAVSHRLCDGCNVEVSSLKNIAIFLEGVKQGRGGNLLPLGNNDLEQLWNAIAFLQGDERFECRDLRN